MKRTSEVYEEMAYQEVLAGSSTPHNAEVRALRAQVFATLALAAVEAEANETLKLHRMGAHKAGTSTVRDMPQYPGSF